MSFLLLSIFLGACAHDPPVEKSSPAGKTSGSATLRVVTFNTHGIPFFTGAHGKRSAEIARLVGSENVDVVAFQEAFHGPDRRLMCDLLARAGLPYHHYFRSWVFGSGLLTVSRYPIRETAFHRFSRGGNPFALRQADWWAGKGAGRVTVSLAGFGDIEVINTHLHARYRGDHYKAVRQSQLGELADFLAASRDTNRPVLLLGDLNHTLRDPGWQRCIRETGLVSLCRPFSKIDHIMALRNPNFSFKLSGCLPLKGTVRGPRGELPISDHTGILSEIRMARVVPKE